MRALVNAIHLPSGDQAAPPSAPVSRAAAGLGRFLRRDADDRLLGPQSQEAAATFSDYLDVDLIVVETELI